MWLGQIATGVPLSLVDPYEVMTTHSGETITISNLHGYEKQVIMKDTLWDRFTGRTWEGKVRKAQRDAFDHAYITVRKEEELNYQAQKLT